MSEAELIQQTLNGRVGIALFDGQQAMGPQQLGQAFYFGEVRQKRRRATPPIDWKTRTRQCHPSMQARESGCVVSNDVREQRLLKLRERVTTMRPFEIIRTGTRFRDVICRGKNFQSGIFVDGDRRLESIDGREVDWRPAFCDLIQLSADLQTQNRSKHGYPHDDADNRGAKPK